MEALPLADAIDLPGWAQLGFAATGAVGLILWIYYAVILIRSTPRTGNEELRNSRQHDIRRWHPTHFSLALQQMREYSQRLAAELYSPSGERGEVSEYDLVRWVVQLGLTASAYIVPNSLGKANLFRVSQIRKARGNRIQLISVYASEFHGVFPSRQLIAGYESKLLRNFSLRPATADAQNTAAALQCVSEERPVLQSLRGRHSSFDAPERDLGVTHILAIPILDSFDRATQDQPVSITVDLRFGRIQAWFLDHTDWTKQTLYSRADSISKLLREVPQLTSTRFLPPTDLRDDPTQPPPRSTTLAIIELDPIDSDDEE